ncbi:unnamed protein product [Schistocephalus solidus]|uniref:Uncharacterized protein n=1 Tax=Schistocephalus solidus TaxID=70667 RepID=A0A183TPA1_SCHSO|nr:unnamed protein product [Schistocephalus solidus]
MGGNLVGKLTKELQKLSASLYLGGLNPFGGPQWSPRDPWEFLTPLGFAVGVPTSFSTARRIDQRLPADPSTPRSEGFPHHGRNSPEHSGVRAVRRWNPRFPNPKNPSVGSAISPRPGACEEVLQAACDQPLRPLFGVTAVQPDTSFDAYTQTSWLVLVAFLESCQTRPASSNTKIRRISKEFSILFNRLKLGSLANENTDYSELQASAYQQDDTKLIKHYLEVPLEGGHALPEVFSDEQQDEKLEE